MIKDNPIPKASKDLKTTESRGKMKKNKVYVVTAGEYSDYHIEKVFSSKASAIMYSMLDEDRQVETYEVDNVDVDVNKPLIKVTYNFGWMNCIWNLEFTSKEIKPHIKVGGYPEYSFVFTMDFSNKRIHQAVMRSGKNSKLIEKAARDKLAEYLYEHGTTKEEIVKKHKEEQAKRFGWPIASSSSVVNEDVAKQLKQLISEGQPLPDLAGLHDMIAQTKQEKKE